MKSRNENMLFIPKYQVPAGKKATYTNALCDNRPLKYDPLCVHITVGGNRLIYPGYPIAPDVSLLDSKLILNRTISTPGDRFFCANIKY